MLLKKDKNTKVLWKDSHLHKTAYNKARLLDFLPQATAPAVYVELISIEQTAECATLSLQMDVT